jgi:NAD(P)-dependent dehydrogenase (short-subunit alcohol dehydrogenase family)
MISGMAATRTVLTTGANSGIGLETAIELARRGYRSVGSVRSEEKAEKVAKAAADAGVEVETVLLDVTDAEACETVMSAVELYGLVNNAGYTGTGAVEDVDDHDVRDQLETMTVAGWYQATKHALEAVTDALRMEVASSGVKVVLVEPGGFRTGIWEDFEREIGRYPDSRFAKAYRRSMVMTRVAQPVMGHPKRVARVIAGALDAGRPRSRYLVGYDAQAVAVMERFTPTFVKDIAIRLGLGL